MIYDYFRVTGAHDTVLDYAGLFSVTLREENVQEPDTRWDGILLSMTKIPPDDILEGLYKLRIRESEQLKSVSELYEMEIHQKISMPNYQKIEDEARGTPQETATPALVARRGAAERRTGPWQSKRIMPQGAR